MANEFAVAPAFYSVYMSLRSLYEIKRYAYSLSCHMRCYMGTKTRLRAGDLFLGDVLLKVFMVRLYQISGQQVFV